MGFLDPCDDYYDSERERCELRELLEVDLDVERERRLPLVLDPLERAGEPLG